MIGFNIVVISFLPKPQPAKTINVLFIVGVFIQGCGMIFDSLSLQFGPQTLKAAFGCLPIVMNIPILYLLNHIPTTYLPSVKSNNVNWRTPNGIYYLSSIVGISIGLIISATSFLVASSSTVYEIEPSLAHRITGDTKTIVYLLVIVGIILGLFLTYMYGVELLLYRIGLLSCICGLLSATSSLLIKLSLHMISSIYRVEAIFLLFAGCCVALLQFFTLFRNANLHEKNTPTQIHITIFTVTNVTTMMITGGVVFDEFITFETLQIGLFSCGTILTLISVIMWAIIHPRIYSTVYV